MTDKLKVDDALQFYSLSVADPGPPLPLPPLFLDQNEAGRAEKNFFRRLAQRLNFRQWW